MAEPEPRQSEIARIDAEMRRLTSQRREITQANRAAAEKGRQYEADLIKTQRASLLHQVDILTAQLGGLEPVPRGGLPIHDGADPPTSARDCLPPGSDPAFTVHLGALSHGPMHPLAAGEDLIDARHSAPPDPEPRSTYSHDHQPISLGIPAGQLNREVNRQFGQRDKDETDRRRNHDRIDEQRNRHKICDLNDPHAREAQDYRDLLARNQAIRDNFYHNGTHQQQGSYFPPRLAEHKHDSYPELERKPSSRDSVYDDKRAQQSSAAAAARRAQASTDTATRRAQAQTDRIRIRTYDQQLDESTKQHNRTSRDRRNAQNEANRAAQFETQNQYYAAGGKTPATMSQQRPKRFEEKEGDSDSDFPSTVSTPAPAPVASPAHVAETDDLTRPLSSTTAHERQSERDALATENSERNARKTKRNYSIMNIQKGSTITKYPFPKGSDIPVCFVAFLQSIDTALNEILVKGDESGDTDLESATWTPGWEKPLQKLFNKALPPSSDPITRAVTNLFTQTEAQVKAGTPGPKAYDEFKRALGRHLDIEESGESMLRLQEFGVDTGLAFAKYLPRLELCITTAQAMQGVHRPTDARVMDIARHSIREQFPGLMIHLFAGEMDVADLPYPDVTSMLAAFQKLSTNKTQAINGDKFFAPVQHSFPKTAAILSKQKGHHAHTPQFIANIRAADLSDPDPCDSKYPGWPLRKEDFAEIMLVSAGFSSADPKLWNPLLSSATRSQFASEHLNHCLNCAEENCSVRECPRPFLNHTGTLNPEIARRHDKEALFRRLQQRYLSHKRGNHAKSVANAHSKHGGRGRNSNNRGRNASGPASTALTLSAQDGRSSATSSSSNHRRG